MSRRHKKKKHPHPPSAAHPKGAPKAATPPVTVANTVDLRHEPPEPTFQPGSVPVLMIAAIIVLLYLADMYVMSHGADLGGQGGAFPKTVYDPYRSHKEVEAANPVDPGRQAFLKGRTVFGNVCVQCHGAGGTGVPGQFPPLAGSEWVLTENPARAIRIVIGGLTGPISVKGEMFNNSMPPWGPTLSDEQIANVLTYVRNEWGNKAPPVTTEQVAKIRQEIANKQDMFTAAELEQIPTTGQ